MRGHKMRRLDVGAWVVKWLAVVALMSIAFGSPSGYAQTTLDNQSAVDAALKELDAAERQAQDNIPDNANLKGAEDTLDAAIRKNEATPDTPVADKQKAQKAQDDAQTRVDDLRARSRPEQIERANRYRDALQKRREARKKLQQEYAAVRRAAGIAQQQGYMDVLKFLQGWVGRLRGAINRAEAPITAPKQTAGVSHRPQRIEVRSPPPVLFPPVEPAAPIFIVDMSGGGVFAEVPQQTFLFRELQGSGVAEPNQVVPSRRINGAFGQFKIAVDNAPLPWSRIYFNFTYYNMEGSSSFGAYDPGANFRVNIPGAEGGASGVSLGGNPLNRVVNILFDNRIESFNGSGGIRVPFNAPGTDTTIEGIFGVGGGRVNSRQTFSAEVPGFSRFFAYDTKADVNIAVADIGLGVTQIIRRGANGVIMFQGEATVSPTYLSADGRDSFSFTGITPSSTELDKSKADVGFNVNGTFSFGLPGSTVVGTTISGPSLYIKGGYETRPGLPVYVRNGTAPTQLELKHADIFTLSGGVRVPFGSFASR